MIEPSPTLPQVLTYRYRFRLSDGREKEFVVRLDYETLTLLRETRNAEPAWTALEFRKCPNCPLDETIHPRCPVATSLVEVVEFFGDSSSFEEVDVSVETEARTYAAHTSLQKGVSSLLGIFMVTAGCPILSKLRPMVDTHLPFMSPEESAYRTLSTYVLAQLFLYRKGKQPDWDLKMLIEFFADVRLVNASFCKRLSASQIGDASINALVILNSLSDFTSFSIEANKLDRLEKLFNR